jgi:flagellar hook-length control protein FliK
MGPQLDAGQFLRPLETPRPAERSDFASAGLTRSENGGESFHRILDDARTPKAPRKAEASPRGACGRDPGPVDRKKHDDAPDATTSQVPSDEPTVAPAPTETEDAAPDMDGASAESSAAKPPGDAQCHALPPQPSIPPPIPVLSLIQGTIVGVVLSPPATEAPEQVDAKTPEPADSALPPPVKEPIPSPDTRPIESPPPVTDIADVKVDDSIESKPTSTPSQSELPTTEKRPVKGEHVSIDQPGSKEQQVVQTKADPKWITEERPVSRPVETPPSAAPIPKMKPALRSGKSPPRPEKGEIRGSDPLNPGPRHEKVGRAASDGRMVEEQRSVQFRPVSVRSGSGDSAAATVGRFLIETTGDGEPTTANVPPQASERAVSVTSTNPTPTRASVERPQKIDVTVTTLSQLLVSGTDGADGLEAAAKALSGTQRPGNHHVTLQLDPPELGQLRLDIRMQHHEMTLRVAADTAEVARLIESRLAELRDALSVHGIRIDRSEVVVRSHGTENANSQSGQQGGSSNGADGNGNGADASGSAWSGEGGLGEAPDQGTRDEPPPGTFISYPEPDVGSESPWEEGAQGATQEMLVDLVA